MINDTHYQLTPSRPTIPSSGLLLPAVRDTRSIVSHASLRWGRRLVWAGRAMLVLFATLAVISANRESGLLTLGAVTQINSAVRGSVAVGVAFLLLPMGAALWLAGALLARPAVRRPLRWSFGPPVVVVPLAILLVLTLAHLSPAIGWVDVIFVLAGLAMLALAYFFVLHDGPTGAHLAGFVAVAGGVQAMVGVGQFLFQHDLGLRWLGELPLNPAISGVSVLASSARVLRAYGLMRHPNALGAILPLSLLAAMSLSMRGDRRVRLLWLALTAVITAGLVLSFSRAGWLAALAGGAVLATAGRALPGSLHRSAWAALAPACLTMALVVVMAIGLQPDLFAGRLLGTLGRGFGVEQTSLTERLSAAQWAWQVIGRWPLWGVGTRRYIVTVAQMMQVRPAERLLVDSTPLLLWAEQGIAGPVTWLGLGVALVWLGCRRAAANVELALATAWAAAIQVVCLFQPYFWPGHELWQGGIWLGLALGLWAQAEASSVWQPPDGMPGGPASSPGCEPKLRDNKRRLGTVVPGADRPGPV